MRQATFVLALAIAASTGLSTRADDGKPIPSHVEVEVGTFLLFRSGTDVVALRVTRMEPNPTDPTESGRTMLEYEWHLCRSNGRFSEEEIETGRGTVRQRVVWYEGGRYGNRSIDEVECGPFAVSDWKASGSNLYISAPTSPEDSDPVIEMASTTATDLSDVDPASRSLTWVRAPAKASD